MGTKQQMQRAFKYLQERSDYYATYFKSMLHNVIDIEGLPDDVPKRYFLKVLFQYGRIAKYGNLYLPCNSVGIDLYGLPTQYILNGYNGYVVTVDANDPDLAILRLNDLEKPITPFIRQQSELLADIDSALRQNLNAIKTMSIMCVKDEKTLLSMENLAKSREFGSTYAFVTGDFIDENVKMFPTNAQYMCDKINELKKEVKDETLCRLGVMSANSNKRERVQATEVNADLGETYDSAMIMVDTFNYDCKVKNVPLKMVFKSLTNEYITKMLSENENNGGTENVN